MLPRLPRREQLFAGLLLSAVLFNSCKNNSDPMPTPVNVQPEITAMQKIDDLIGGKTSKTSFVDMFVKTEFNFFMDAFINGVNLHKESTVKAGMNNMQNPGELRVSNIVIPYTGKLYYLFTSSNSSSPFSGQVPINFNSYDGGVFPSFAANVHGTNELVPVYHTSDTMRNLSRKNSFTVAWLTETHNDPSKKTHVILEGKDYVGAAPKLFVKSEADETQAVTISPEDLKQFEKCGSVDIYVVRGKVDETSVTTPDTRIRSIAYAVQNIQFRD